jgi:hypothetical protein
MGWVLSLCPFSMPCRIPCRGGMAGRMPLEFYTKLLLRGETTMYFKDKHYYMDKFKEFLGMLATSALFVAMLLFFITMA